MSKTATGAVNVLWLQSGGCGGCNMSLLRADTVDLAGTLVRSGIHVLWHPSLSVETGAEAQTILQACLDGEIELHALCVEGAMLRDPNGAGRFHVLAGTGVPMIAWVTRLAQAAHFTIAIRTCAAFGGISAGGANHTEACGLQFHHLLRLPPAQRWRVGRGQFDFVAVQLAECLGARKTCGDQHRVSTPGGQCIARHAQGAGLQRIEHPATPCWWHGDAMRWLNSRHS
ncbi:NADH-quinone oxidoreductase subunit B family protein [Paraburkholderia nodosa]|uniref:NADH-quinone oxidoreductase subunit B family protein n=1 Tax=Paraburkholderia nodosa TaxID=392320 RepID=UPI0009DE6BFD|nr:hypothetical protein [Paraburkholderia nodosa]